MKTLIAFLFPSLLFSQDTLLLARLNIYYVNDTIAVVEYMKTESTTDQYVIECISEYFANYRKPKKNVKKTCAKN